MKKGGRYHWIYSLRKILTIKTAEEKGKNNDAAHPVPASPIDKEEGLLKGK